MEKFKFVKRDTELSNIMYNLKSNKIILLDANNKSGLSHFLKKIWLDFCKDNETCFYIDGEENQNLSQQILYEVLSYANNTELEHKLKNYPKKNVILAIIKSLIYPLDLIPYIPNIGSTIVNFIDCIDETLDVDIEHVHDYKIEKAIFKLFSKLDNTIYFIIDNPEKLSRDSYNFLIKLYESFDVKIVLAFPNCNIDKKMEIISRNFSSNALNIKQLNDYFERPDNELIEALFVCYEKEYDKNLIDYFEKYNRNIHVIMAYLKGFKVNLDILSEEETHILKILIVLNTDININVLFKIYKKKNLKYSEIEYNEFNNYCDILIKHCFIKINSNNLIVLNKNLISEVLIEIPFIEKQIITTQIIDVIETSNQITIAQCEFAINHLSKDYSRRKEFIFKLIKLESFYECINSNYLDMIFSFNNLNDLIKICSLYYNLHIFDAPYIKMQQYKKYQTNRAYKILFALITERLHIGRYATRLENIVKETENIDQKCLLLSTLFVAYLNTNSDDKKYSMLQNPKDPFYYKKFSKSSNYPYLLRNVSYYILNVNEGIKNYNYCLSQFKNRDPINYNRTISNYICYLMKNDKNKQCISILESKINEVEQILSFNDERYIYLNVNYGLYLMKYNKGNPEKYFKCITYASGTTETPYIYAQINLAIYTLKKNPIKALEIMDVIEYNVQKTSVIMTKQFYMINRCLIEYANGNYDYELIASIRKTPFRGDKKYVENLYIEYKKRFDNNIVYTNSDWNKLHCPGYLFYRYYDVNKLFI